MPCSRDQDRPHQNSKRSSYMLTSLLLSRKVQHKSSPQPQSLQWEKRTQGKQPSQLSRIVGALTLISHHGNCRESAELGHWKSDWATGEQLEATGTGILAILVHIFSVQVVVSISNFAHLQKKFGCTLTRELSGVLCCCRFEIPR